VTEHPAFRGRGDLANQIQRASLSVPNNIAEGFERGTTPELLQFLYYAKGSAGEVRSICHVLERMEPFGHLKSEISDLRSLARSISRQLGGWAFSLQESDIKGSRHLTQQSKAVYYQKQDAQTLMAEIRAINAEEAKKRFLR
jgi:four helix bundle protein